MKATQIFTKREFDCGVVFSRYFYKISQAQRCRQSFYKKNKLPYAAVGERLSSSVHLSFLKTLHSFCMIIRSFNARILFYTI